jgi:hypothetical protein
MDAWVRDVDPVEVAVTIEGRTFEKSGDRHAGMRLARPGRKVRSVVSAQIIGKPHEHFSLNHLRWIKVIHVESPFPAVLLKRFDLERK